MKKQITINYDDGPEAAQDAVEDVLISLGIKYKIKNEDESTVIEFDAPEEK